MSVPVPPDPEDLRATLRRVATEAPDEAHERIADALCDHLAGTWGTDIAHPALVRQVVESCRYESYLWVMGDRRWSQLADTLIGRLQRRRHHPAGAAARAPASHR